MNLVESVLQTSILKAAFACALIGIVVSLASFAMPSFPVAVLCFFFCFCWVFWLVCAVAYPINNGIRLTAIWAVINLGILAMFISVTATNGDVMTTMGNDVVWLITYFPVIIPSGLAFAFFPHGIEGAINTSTNWLAPAYRATLSAWLTMSFIGIFQSLLIFQLSRLVHRRCASQLDASS
jgi:hypothetical protein